MNPEAPAALSETRVPAMRLPRWLRQLLPVLAGAVSVAALLLVARTVLSPYRLLPRDRIWLFVGECPYSMAAFHSVMSSQIARQRVIPVPVVGLQSRVGAEVCPATLSRLAEDGSPWLNWMPKSLACHWLARDAEKFFDQHFIRFPSFSVGLTPIADGQEVQTLLEHGIRIELSDEGTASLVPRESPAKPRAARPPRAPTVGDEVPPTVLPIGW